MELREFEKEVAISLNNVDQGDTVNSFIYGYEDLTPSEKKLIKENPWVAFKAKVCADIAWNITESRYGQGHNDWRDAFRHGLWNALMVRDIGIVWASKWATAHEDNPRQPKIEKEMDLYNNWKGRQLGSSGGNNSNTGMQIKQKN
jgi:hypothetical protein